MVNDPASFWGKRPIFSDYVNFRDLCLFKVTCVFLVSIMVNHHSTTMWGMFLTIFPSTLWKSRLILLMEENLHHLGCMNP